MSKFLKITLLIICFTIISNCSDNDQANNNNQVKKTENVSGKLKVTDLDLKNVLNHTVPVIVNVAKFGENSYNKDKSIDKVQYTDYLFIDLLPKELTKNYNSATPIIYSNPIGVYPATTGSLVAFEDNNKNQLKEEYEENLFFIDIDSENSRVVATSRIGASENASFPAGALFTGLLLGRMMGLQNNYPNFKNQIQKQTRVTPQQAINNARSRSGSGSHRSGK